MVKLALKNSHKINQNVKCVSLKRNFPMHPVTKMSSFWRYTSNNFCFNVLATRTFNIQFSCYFLPPEFFLVCFFIVFPLPVIDYFIFAKPIDHFFLLVFGQIGIFVLLPLNIWRALCFGQFSIIVTTLGMTLKIWDFLLGPLGFLSIISMVIRVSFWSSYSYWTGTLRLSWLCDLRPFLGRHLPNVGLPHINLEQKWRADDCPLPFIV